MFDARSGFEPVSLSRDSYLGRTSRSLCTMTNTAQETIDLPDGSKFPTVGFGTWKIPKGSSASLVQTAIEKGYRAIDCACDYGNEKEVGAGIASAIESGVVSRDELFVTSKLWNTFHRTEHVKPALKRTLSDLKLDFIDLYMIHFPISLAYVPFEKRYPPEWVHDPASDDPKMNMLVQDHGARLHETWRAMEALVRDGRVKAIGVCNYPVAMLMQLMAYAEIKPAMVQVELHPYLCQDKLLAFCKRSGLPVTAFSPLGASSYVELGMDGGLGKGALGDPVVGEVAKRVGKTPAQVLLRWGLQRGTAIIPKTSKVERLSENIELFDFEISEEDMDKISALDRGLRFNDPGEFCKGMGFSIPIYD